MGIRFSKSIKLGSLVRLNISKSGVSASIGPKGASINLGKNGTYLNLSPSVAGISGTGLSYRQKITSGYGSVLKKITGQAENKSSLKKNTTTKLTKKETQEEVLDTSIIEEYEQNLEANIHIHKYADAVLSKKEFDEKINTLESDSSKAVYQMLIDGQEDTIESSIGAFLNNLDLNYDVKANYELEDHILYVDLDLPEIEDFSSEYPCLIKNKIVTKNKTTAELKKEYAKTVLSIGVYVCANFFNVSSYIDSIVLSAFTTRRNNDGDLKDEYLYSVKYLKDNFVATNLSEVEDIYDFFLKFENRINLSTAYTFKGIKPYEMEAILQSNSLVEDAIAGLKELGYKASDINGIVEELSKAQYETAGEYLKEGLRLLANK